MASSLQTPELGAARPQPGQPVSSAHPAAELTRVGWTPSTDIGLDEWSAVGRRFGEIGRCSQWWLGDWIHYGNARFGERYSRAVKLTGYDAQSLMNMVYVASRFEIYRRRENLSWSHHAAVAALDVADQEHWLSRASADKLSVADLRVELRSARRAGAELADAGDPPKQLAIAHTLVCPNCGETVPVAD
ncbi:MAG: hypothetical protein ACLPUT_09090 [Solirubrobacteraceae bacterium]